MGSRFVVQNKKKLKRENTNHLLRAMKNLTASFWFYLRHAKRDKTNEGWGRIVSLSALYAHGWTNYLVHAHVNYSGFVRLDRD